jgi:excinuclease ABC subunit A
MDRPAVDRIDGVPPAIAIDQTNPVRTSRSTVGTMTEVNDHLKLLFARAAALFCRNCGQRVCRDTPDTIVTSLSSARASEPASRACRSRFRCAFRANFSEDEVRERLNAQGYSRVFRERVNGDAKILDVVADRFTVENVGRPRIVDALERALRLGGGLVDVHADLPEPQCWRYSVDLHCADCEITTTRRTRRPSRSTRRWAPARPAAASAASSASTTAW